MTRYAIYDAAGRMVEGTTRSTERDAKFACISQWHYVSPDYDVDAWWSVWEDEDGYKCLPVPATEPVTPSASPAATGEE